MKREWRPFPPRPFGRPLILTSLTREESDALARLAKGRIVAEIGTAFGYSAIVMALGGAKKVVTADPHIWLKQQHGIDSWLAARDNATAYSVRDRIELRKGTAADVFAGQFGRYGFVFVDGDHTRSAVYQDAIIAEGLVEPGGYIAFHDYGEVSCPDVKAALDEAYPDGPDRTVGTLWIRRTEVLD